MYTIEVTVSSFNKNNLAKCLSPYLQQHADQPVHWQPWSTDTLEYAKQQNKPILLSIGYSACHWCHKMAEESFSNHDTAQIMNHHFVNIKVDREERSDLDKLYQQAHFLLNQRSGGWPLTVFIEPKSLLPFFAGTYFPPEPIDGLASFPQILMTISDIFQHKYTDVLEMCVSIKQSLIPVPNQTKAFSSLDELVSKFISDVDAHSDPEWGGLSGSPKFPQPVLYRTALNIILYRRPDQSEQLYQHIMRAAQSMSRIGLFDHLAGGFFRYCVDHYWGVPHFEKMLSDNALLMAWYADLATFNKEGSMANVCQQTFRWLSDEMQLESGVFGSSLSADSEDKEGQFYLFDRTEIENLLSAEQWSIAKVAFGLEQAPNFDGRWHLHQWYSTESLAEKLSLPLKQVQWSLDPIKQTLLDYRNQRARPARDDKALTGWNALLASALFKSGQLLNNETMIESAQAIISTIKNKLWLNGQLYSCYRNDSAYQSACLDDYAYLANAILHRLSYQWSTDYFIWLTEITEKVFSQFYRTGAGFEYSNNSDVPLQPIYLTDDALPSGCAMVIEVVSQLSKFTGNIDHSTILDEILQHASIQIHQSSLAHASLINAYLIHGHRAVVVVRGSASELVEWQSQLQPALGLTHQLLFIPNNIKLPDTLSQRYPLSKQPRAFISLTANDQQIVESIDNVIQLLKQ